MQVLAERFLNSKWGAKLFLWAILVNAVAVGVSTYTVPGTSLDGALASFDYLILGIFTLELALRMVAAGSARVWLRDPWNVFDFCIVGVCFFPNVGSFAGVARTLRILRTLKTVNAFPDLRNIVSALLKSLPSMANVAMLLLMLMYVYAVIGTSLFGQVVPQYFGSLHRSLLSLFQCMTLEGWNAIMDEVLVTHQFAWVFFVSYIFCATFILFNLFVGVIVSNLEAATLGEQVKEETEKIELLIEEVRSLRLLVEKHGATGRS